MLSRSWIAAIAFGLASLAASCPVIAQTSNGVSDQAVSPSVESEAAGTTEGEHGTPNGFSLPVVILETPEQAEHSTERERSADKHDAEDLKAQRDAAEAAQRSADIAERTLWPTWAQVCLGLLGTVLLGLSLIFSARATKAAADAAKSAEQVLKAERAWMTFDSVTTLASPRFDNETGFFPDPFGLRVEWRNSGRSPALNVEFWSKVEIIGIDDDLPVFAVPGDLGERRRTTIGQNMGGSGVACFFEGNDCILFKQRMRRAIIYSHVSYNDIFEPNNETSRHTTETCIEIMFRGYLIRGDGRRAADFSRMPIGPQNTAT